MIRQKMPLYNVALLLHGEVTECFSQRLPQFPIQRLLPALRFLYHMILAFHFAWAKLYTPSTNYSRPVNFERFTAGRLSYIPGIVILYESLRHSRGFTQEKLFR
jgi:hypothetical protein